MKSWLWLINIVNEIKFCAFKDKEINPLLFFIVQIEDEFCMTATELVKNLQLAIWTFDETQLQVQDFGCNSRSLISRFWSALNSVVHQKEEVWEDSDIPIDGFFSATPDDVFYGLFPLVFERWEVSWVIHNWFLLAFCVAVHVL